MKKLSDIIETTVRIDYQDITHVLSQLRLAECSRAIFIRDSELLAQARKDTEKQLRRRLNAEPLRILNEIQEDLLHHVFGLCMRDNNHAGFDQFKTKLMLLRQAIEDPTIED